jgi:hypothetical protein
MQTVRKNKINAANVPASFEPSGLPSALIAAGPVASGRLRIGFAFGNDLEAISDAANDAKKERGEG